MTPTVHSATNARAVTNRERKNRKAMKKRRHFFIGVLLFAFVSACTARAQDEITLIGPNIIDAPVKELIPRFEAKSGRKVNATFGAVVATKDRIIGGEPVDVALVEVPYDSDVIKSGNVVPESATPLANVSIGVSVHKGAPQPDISSSDAVKRLLLGAKSISYPDPSKGAAAGISVVEALKKLGIAEQMEPKTKLSQGGARAMALVASGDAEVGLTFLPGMTNPGIEVLGALPRDVSPPTVVIGFVSARAKDPAAAKQLLDYLSSEDAATVYKAQRFQPGR
jgi:molybdate transport system substrate-binding protein